MKNTIIQFCIFAVLLIFNCSNTNQKNENNIYNNSIIGLKLAFPDTWIIVKNEPNETGDLDAVSGIKKLADNNDAYFNLVYVRTEQDKSLSTVVEESKNSLTDFYTNDISFENTEIIQINNSDTGYFTYTDNSNPDFINKCNKYFIIKNEYLVIFGFEARVDYWPMIKNDIDFIIDSLSLN